MVEPHGIDVRHTLGIADMLGTDITITSTDPTSGDEITVAIHSGWATWRPATTGVHWCRHRRRGGPWRLLPTRRRLRLAGRPRGCPASC